MFDTSNTALDIMLIVLIVILLVQTILSSRHPHIPSIKECVITIIVFIILAILFGIAIYYALSPSASLQFFSGYLTEYSLSIDNLFVFSIIMTNFKVPKKYQKKVLAIGIFLSLFLRAIFIMLGAVIIEKGTWVFYLFGAFLIYTAWGLATENEDDEPDEYKENLLVRYIKKVIPITKDYIEGKTVVRRKNSIAFTPMFIVFIAIGTTDIMFAFDSIPAIFGLTKDPFIVFSANVFALMGLMQLYFLFDKLLNSLKYLPKGLAIILGFIGSNLILEALHTNNLPFINNGNPIHQVPEVPTELSLLVIVSVITISVIVSLIWGKPTENND